MSNYPPGVTGNEPQITGEWPCDMCGGMGYDEDEDGKQPCETCNGTGIIPEDNIDIADVKDALENLFSDNGWGKVYFEGNDDCIAIHTDLKQVGGSWLRVED
jgi:DnaJ-class molecular chaperone